MSDEKIKRILIVEDEKSYLNALVFRLQKSGYEVESATNGNEAIEAVKARHFDLLMLDLIMPKMNGFRVLEEIKAMGITLPAIVLSNLEQISDETKARNLGAFDFLPKSNVMISEVVARVQKFFATAE